MGGLGGGEDPKKEVPRKYYVKMIMEKQLFFSLS